MRISLGKLLSTSFVALAAATSALAACGTDATGVEACRAIEEARCKRAPACGVDMNVPPHRDSPMQDVEACVRFYRDACLHGMAVPDPGGPAIQSCVDTLVSADCAIVLHPETHLSCAFLTPPAVVPATDAAPDVTDAADATDK